MSEPFPVKLPPSIVSKEAVHEAVRGYMRESEQSLMSVIEGTEWLHCPNCGSANQTKFVDLDAMLTCHGCGFANRRDAWVEPKSLQRRESDKVGNRKNKYAREIKGVQIDFYDIARAFGIHDPAIAHALKKLLRYGCGEKSLAKDVDEAIFSLQRWQQDVTPTNPAPNDSNPKH